MALLRSLTVNEYVRDAALEDRFMSKPTGKQVFRDSADIWETEELDELTATIRDGDRSCREI